MTAIHAATVITPHYRAHARVLAESFLAHHPGGRFSALVVGAGEDERSHEEPFELFVPADIGIDERELHRRATMYLAQGLVSSLKPNFLGWLLARERAPVVLLDADSCIYADLAPIADLAERHSIVLSPHTLDPHPLHGAERSEPRWRDDSPDQIIFRAGVMNAGFLAVGPRASEFLQWWAQRTHRRCVFDESRGLMLCQTWLTLASALFEHHLLRDRGCNVAGWNLQARDVEWQGQAPMIDGQRLRHFHFAGSFDPERPWLLTPIEAHAAWWPSLEDRPGVARLAGEYAERLIDRGYRQSRARPACFDRAPDGTPIEPWMRASYRAALQAAETSAAPEPPNPFSHGAARFLGWLSDQTEDQLSQPTVNGSELAASELTAALLHSAELLARVGELEQIRDEAIQWARRASDELEQASELIARQRQESQALLSELCQLSAKLAHDESVMNGVWRSLSWRITKPLRSAKALLTRTHTP